MYICILQYNLYVFFFIFYSVLFLSLPNIKDYVLVAHVRARQKMREYKLRKAETDKEFLECTLCFDDRLLESEMVVCEENIEHKFCSTCVRRYIETQLSDGTRVR